MSLREHTQHKRMKPIPIGEQSPHVKLKTYGLFALGLYVSFGLFVSRELTWFECWDALIGGPNHTHPNQVIMWWVKVPQLLTALMAGGILSMSGAAMQNLMRNDLADPYLIGVAAGGGLGAALSITFGLIDSLGIGALPFCSFLGALSASLWIDYLSRTQSTQSLMSNPAHLVLAGVALNLFLSALLTLTLSLSDDQLSNIWRWLIGHIHILSWYELTLLTVISLITIKLLHSQNRGLELMCGGEEVAWSLGVNIWRVRRLTLIAVSLGVGTVVAFCGIIGFVGLLVPHFIRPRISGASDRLLSLSLLYGGLVLGGCHLLSILMPIALPIGVITGVIGGSIFLMTMTYSTRMMS